MNSSEDSIELTVEQSFAITAFNSQVDRANLEQARQLAKDVYYLQQRQIAATRAMMKWQIQQDFDAIPKKKKSVDLPDFGGHKDGNY